MPLFIKKPNTKILFIHIPKTGGTSIEKCMVDNGYAMKLHTISHKTPNHQHYSYRQLKARRHIKNNTRIFTIIRDEIERTLSEFFYLKQKREHIAAIYAYDEAYTTSDNFDRFLNIFCKMNNAHLFDFHNMPNDYFLLDFDGTIPSNITQFNYFDTNEISQYLGVDSLDQYNYLDYGQEFELTQSQIDRVREYFANCNLQIRENLELEIS